MFKEHARMIANRVDEVTRRLTWIMPNIGGAKSHRNRLLATVSQSIMLYGAPVWAKHMGRKGWNILDRSNRKIGLRVIAAYRTVSKSAVEIISGMPPPELIAEYRRSMKVTEEKVGAEERLIQAWQSKWEPADNGRWTYRLIPNVNSWYKRKHGMIDFHLTQALTGHGCFSAYLHRFGKLASSACMFCEYHTHHIHVRRLAYTATKRRNSGRLRSYTGQYIGSHAVLQRELERITKFITAILKHKEEEERIREQEVQ